MPATSHEVSVHCVCEDVEHCSMEIYIADIRILVAELERLKANTPEKEPPCP